ncbi:Glucose/ribitol dehydrogenase [Penicillium atrosanguineum]|uniref:Glucose/ribitol dehydrogenase n=1 Tax=Penicillium atrosanguineum TaxID=1132637 RepID=UPI002392EF45|nr:Glucose/ribitol dehydrogenase [Penicillium atrosanguineum]KAJ5314244.1 Glucose/ribitol dehydrogenase [Penicillium atrosanguineum]
MGSELGLTADSKSELDTSAVSIFWVAFGCIWTAIIVAGASYLIVNRNTPTIRIRGLWLSLSAVAFLHLYAWSVQFGLLIGALMPGDIEFWIMGTYLPCGIALFHASNSRFLHVAKLQKKFIHHDGHNVAVPPVQAKRGLLAKFRRLDYTAKTVWLVSIAMVVQIFLTVLMYLISRKWHSSWGIPGTEVTGTIMEQRAEQGRGWEWWPSVAWQFFWSWVFAPYILWQSRNIHDTQGWRTQTIGCAIVMLPATPMWLIGLYVDGMAPVNAVWLPPQWIVLSIFFIEIFTVLLPCWEVLRASTLRQETLDAIAQWERRNKSMASGSTFIGSIMSGWKSMNGSVKTNSSSDSILTMSALEHVLERNPIPLLEFSALREFSGENIAFLISIAQWKSSIPAAVRDGSVDGNTKDSVRDCFNNALHIYAEFISVRHAEFPVNISHQDLRKLENIFEKPTRILYGEKRDSDVITPFEGADYNMEPASPTYSSGSEKAMNVSASAIKERVHYWGEIPADFGAAVFDESEESIKYLVLTNTWPKFIRNHRTSIGSVETLEAGNGIVEMADLHNEK